MSQLHATKLNHEMATYLYLRALVGCWRRFGWGGVGEVNPSVRFDRLEDRRPVMSDAAAFFSIQTRFLAALRYTQLLQSCCY